MPTTPFIGISVLIHVGVILFHKIFRIKPRMQHAVVPLTSRHYIFSTIIVVSMFSVMLFMAFGLLSASVHEQHSTVYLVEDTAQWLAADNGGSQIIAAVGGEYRTQALGIAGAVLLFIGIISLIPRIRFPRTAVSSVTQGGYSRVQTSLLMGGLLSLLISITYIVIYLLIAFHAY